MQSLARFDLVEFRLDLCVRLCREQGDGDDHDTLKTNAGSSS
ncbi:MAG: hypothetical protein ACLS3C_07310 [Oscillospiraceae bacterium]